MLPSKLSRIVQGPVPWPLLHPRRVLQHPSMPKHEQLSSICAASGQAQKAFRAEEL